MEDSRVAEYTTCQLQYKSNYLQYQQAKPSPQLTLPEYQSSKPILLEYQFSKRKNISLLNFD